jgi:hypothetical protein
LIQSSTMHRGCGTHGTRGAGVGVGDSAKESRWSVNDDRMGMESRWSVNDDRMGMGVTAGVMMGAGLAAAA